MRKAVWLGVAFLGATACSSAPVAPPLAPPPAKVRPPWPDPPEHQIPHLSEEAGEDIFGRIGVGDPYRTGLPYPIFLALLQMYPDLMGARVPEFTERFGFTPRAAA